MGTNEQSNNYMSIDSNGCDSDGRPWVDSLRYGECDDQLATLLELGIEPHDDVLTVKPAKPTPLPPHLWRDPYEEDRGDLPTW